MLNFIFYKVYMYVHVCLSIDCLCMCVFLLYALQAGMCVGEKVHASVQLHGVGGVFLQLSGSTES